jgi:hypothetical protein
MADKKKAGVSVVPTFVAGEQPTADKFNAIGVQLQRAASELEKAVGDVWGESWPYSATDSTKLTLPYGRNLTDCKSCQIHWPCFQLEPNHIRQCWF